MAVQARIQEYERKQARAAKQKIIQNVISDKGSGRRKHARKQSGDEGEDQGRSQREIDAQYQLNSQSVYTTNTFPSNNSLIHQDNQEPDSIIFQNAPVPDNQDTIVHEETIQVEADDEEAQADN